MDTELKNIVDPEATGTSQDTQTPSPAPEDSNEGNQDKTQETTPSINWEKRYSDSSRENSRITSEMKQLQSEFLGFVTRDRNTFEQYVESKNLSPEQKQYWMNYYDTEVSPNTTPAKATENNDVPTLPQTPPNPVREQWMREMDDRTRAKIQERTAQADIFWSREENKSLPRSVRESIATTALMLDEEYNYSPDKALEVARKRILDPEAIKEEGYSEGVRDSMLGGFSRGISGGASQSEDKDRLPLKEEAFIKSEVARKGLTPEQETVLRKKIAERLALRS